MTDTQTLDFAQRLKQESRTTHDSVDNLVMSTKPFSSRENYLKFLLLQSVFHKVVDDVYKDAELNRKIPNLAELARYDAVVQDLKDFDAQPYVYNGAMPILEGAKAIGWLYCAEGSNLGAAFLYKEAAQQLQLSGENGARHLAPHADGRAKHWKEFVGYLNNLGLSKEQEDEAIAGALEAFAFYKEVLRDVFKVQ